MQRCLKLPPRYLSINNWKFKSYTNCEKYRLIEFSILLNEISRFACLRFAATNTPCPQCLIYLKRLILLATAKLPKFQVYVLYTTLIVDWNRRGTQRVPPADTLCPQAASASKRSALVFIKTTKFSLKTIINLNFCDKFSSFVQLLK